eukprot:TRINITY_DN27555_c0_g1_i1.p1 TRINITY_DN27555_c0_g1~~TRINITY_DN27555_c0_g1_i1.p1  ORF type:complete len:498 (+),score=49.46 TRINITY_DN27555_c0_g1_i1:63-1556(+)
MTRSASPPSSSNTIDATQAYHSTKGGFRRTQSRPIGEFGGNLGCLFWTLAIPMCVWYFYGCVVLREGALMVPDTTFWYELVFGLPEGLAIRPTWTCFSMFTLWILFQALMEILLPATTRLGVTLKNGRRLEYPMNGLLCFLLSHIVCYAICFCGLLEPQFVWMNMGSLLTSAVIISFLISVWVYVDFGVLWKNHADDPEFEEDWGIFKWKDAINDFFLGTARNPRVLHSLLNVPFDVKRFSNARPGLTGWVICNQSYLAAIYYGCQLDNGMPVCASDGDFSRVGWTALLITLSHCYYIFDYNWNEPAYLTTTDIRHDLYGFMLAYGCLGFLPWFYSISFLGYISFQRVPLNNNPVQFTVGATLYVVGMFLFRRSNSEKNQFRTYIADGGDLSKYIVWGKPVEYIRTEEGSCLLTSGYWSLARHFNYVGDMVMCVGWAIACSGPSHGIPWIPLSYCAYFWIMDIHRLVRDEARCSTKYKKDWERYKEVVRWCILPGIY